MYDDDDEVKARLRRKAALVAHEVKHHVPCLKYASQERCSICVLHERAMSPEQIIDQAELEK